MEATLTQLLTLIEDDNKTTRLVSCRVLTRLFDLMGTVLGQDRLHNMYPELLKVTICVCCVSMVKYAEMFLL